MAAEVATETTAMELSGPMQGEAAGVAAARCCAAAAAVEAAFGLLP